MTAPNSSAGAASVVGPTRFRYVLKIPRQARSGNEGSCGADLSAGGVAAFAGAGGWLAEGKQGNRSFLAALSRQQRGFPSGRVGSIPLPAHLRRV